MRRSHIRKMGARGREWEACRKRLKVRFERAGITRCENCNDAFALGFAHRLPRRDIATPEELERVALLCQRCHATVDLGSRDDTTARIDEIIARREVAV